MVEEIMEKSEVKLKKLNERAKVECPISNLVVGLQCGGSGAFSGVTANPAVVYAADLLVRAGAKVMFSELTEIRDAVHLLAPRTVNKEVLQKLINEIKWYDNYLEQATPASNFVCGTQQLASRITLQVFTTGRGTTYNLNVSPVKRYLQTQHLKKNGSI